MTTGYNQLSGWTEKKLQSTSQSQTCTKKEVMVTLWWSAACLTHYSFLNPSKTITSEKYAQQIDVMHWEVQCLQLALVNIRAQFSMPTPTCTSHKPITLKVEWIGLQSFASSAIFSWPLANQLPLLQAFWQLFAGKMLPQPVEGRRCFPRVHWIQKHGFFHYRNKQAYFSLAKKCWL